MKKLQIIAFSLLAASSIAFAQQNYYDVTPGNGYGLRLWSSDNFKIDMGNGANYNYGPVTDYSMKFNMSLNAGRGWTWGSWGVPIAGLSVDGTMKIAGGFTALKLSTSATGGSVDAGNVPESGDIIIRSYTGGRSATTGAQLEFVIPANTDGTNFWGQGRIITVAGNGASGSATGKMILGTRRYFDKLGSGMMWYYGDDLTIDGNGNVGIGTSSPSHKLSLNASESQTTLGGNTQSALRIMNNYAEAFGRRSELQFGLNSSYDQTLAVIAAEYSSWNTTVGGDLVFGTSPTSSPDVLERMRINSVGDVGIGTTSPGAKLEIVSDNSMLRFRPTSTATKTPLDIMNLGWVPGGSAAINVAFRLGYPYANGVNSGARLDLLKAYNGNTILATDESGNNLGDVGIGTTNTHGFKLAVAGKTITEEVVVQLQANWPDYVFENDYKLPSLSELEQYIKTNKHLPEVPTAEQVKENGLSVGEMNAILLKKVEELTMYLIEIKKENNGLKTRIESLENKK